MAAKVFGGRVRVQQTERPTSFNLWMLTPEEKKNARMKGTRAQVEKKEPTPTVVPFDSPLAFV